MKTGSQSGCSKMLSKLKELTFYLVWVLVVFIFQFTIEIYETVCWYWRQVFKRLIGCLPSYSSQGELVHLANITRKLYKNSNKKAPKHIGIIVFEQTKPAAITTLLNNFNLQRKVGTTPAGDSSNCGIDLQALVKVITWAWISDFSVVSLFDNNGILKSKYHELGCLLQDEIIQSMWAVKRTDLPPKIKFHNVPQINGYTNGFGHSNGDGGGNGLKQSDTFHIYLYSFEDGRPAIVKAAKNIFKEVVKPMDQDLSLLSFRKHMDNGITESVVETKLNDLIVALPDIRNKDCTNSNSICSRDIKTDPDLLVILDNSYQSTLRFRPWQIHLTEIHWLPTLQRIEISDFLKALEAYANCHQRFGT